ncbi:DUF2513 domain-containing protein [Aliivibrio fischeri]|uniref:DUF2513 domain-containing protein n=1 Tax=Aliivibrio fischeri TaxID=668 RepID=UPI00080EB1C4|nr:DUF2513 domain-containing protein [Aliivibrio fischeri]OCH01414.1 DUF2513 domain-containing protein [Aliivibrio fischeri]OCH22524.1 DUF2513 domain-containing protein [Aliivibrio fischeri]OCH58455.1 DUF2513 domain-containing protein [Aliivibrio fischeri]
MRIDIGYVSELLSVFLNSDNAHIDINDFEKNGIKIESDTNTQAFDEKFLFHFQLLTENRLISNRSLQCGDLRDLGISFGFGGDVCLSIVDLRLTQKGHDFALALNNKEILDKLKSELKDAPFKTIFDGSQKLLQYFCKKKLNELLDDGA